MSPVWWWSWPSRSRSTLSPSSASRPRPTGRWLETMAINGPMRLRSAIVGASGSASCSRRQGGCASQNSSPGLVETNSGGGAAPGVVVGAGGPGVPGRGRSGAAATWTQRWVAHRTRWHCEPEVLGGPCRGNLDGMKARRPRGDADFTSDDGVFAEAAGDTLYQMHPAGCTKPDSRHLNAVTSLGDWSLAK